MAIPGKAPSSPQSTHSQEVQWESCSRAFTEWEPEVRGESVNKYAMKAVELSFPCSDSQWHTLSASSPHCSADVLSHTQLVTAHTHHAACLFDSVESSSWFIISREWVSKTGHFLHTSLPPGMFGSLSSLCSLPLVPGKGPGLGLVCPAADVITSSGIISILWCLSRGLLYIWTVGREAGIVAQNNKSSHKALNSCSRILSALQTCIVHHPNNKAWELYGWADYAC